MKPIYTAILLLVAAFWTAMVGAVAIYCKLETLANGSLVVCGIFAAGSFCISGFNLWRKK